MKTMNGSDNYDEFTGFSLELTTFQIINKNIYQRQPTEDNIITFEQVKLTELVLHCCVDHEMPV